MEADGHVDDAAIVHVESHREALLIFEKLSADMTLIDSVQVKGRTDCCWAEPRQVLLWRGAAS